MSVFKHRFTVKKPENTESNVVILPCSATGVDGAQAGKSVLKWEHRKRVK